MCRWKTTALLTCAGLNSHLQWFSLNCHTWWRLHWLLYIFTKLLFQVFIDSFLGKQNKTTSRNYLLLNLIQAVVFQRFKYYCSCLQNKGDNATKNTCKQRPTSPKSPEWSPVGTLRLWISRKVKIPLMTSMFNIFWSHNSYCSKYYWWNQNLFISSTQLHW